MKNKIFFIFLFFSSVAAGNASDKFDSLLTAGIHQIYNIKFSEAEKTFDYVRLNYPKHPAGKFFDAMITWWKILLDFDNDSYDEVFISKLDDVIEMCDNIIENDPENIDALFFKGGALGFRGKLYSVRESWLKAAMDGKDALPIVRTAFELDPGNKDIQLGFGIYNYYAAVIPEKYPFVKPLLIFFPSGDKVLGLEQLNDAAMNGRYAKYEARYFLMTLYMLHENNTSLALKYADMLRKDFPDNPTFHRYYGRVFVKMNKMKQAQEIFDEVINKYEAGMAGYNSWVLREALYYVGISKFRSNEYTPAESFFNRSLDLSKTLDSRKGEISGFQINTLVNLGLIAKEKSEREKAIKFFEEVLNYRDFQNSHNIAEKNLDILIKD